MKYHNDIEVILLSKHSSTDLNQKALIRWLTTTLQPAIDKQEEHTGKMILKIFKDAPVIFLS